MPDVTLRPMTLGEVLDRTFSLYKSKFWLFVGVAAFPNLLFLFFNVISALTTRGRIGIVRTGQNPFEFSPAMWGETMVRASVMIVLYFCIVSAVNSATVFAVSDSYMGQDASVRGSYRKVGTKFFRVLLMIFLFFVVTISSFVFVAIVGGVLSSPVVIFLGFLLLIIPLVIFFCRMAVAVPVAMLENAGAIRSIERSFHLTKGFAGQIFLILLLVLVLTYVAILILQMPTIILAAISVAAHKQPSLVVIVIQQIAAFFSQVLVGPIGTIAFALMYYNLRVRKEAFDIQHLLSALGPEAVPPPAPLAP